jgi:hypothetical protein
MLIKGIQLLEALLSNELPAVLQLVLSFQILSIQGLLMLQMILC